MERASNYPEWKFGIIRASEFALDIAINCIIGTFRIGLGKCLFD